MFVYKASVSRSCRGLLEGDAWEFLFEESHRGICIYGRGDALFKLKIAPKSSTASALSLKHSVSPIILWQERGEDTPTEKFEWKYQATLKIPQLKCGWSGFTWKLCTFSLSLFFPLTSAIILPGWSLCQSLCILGGVGCLFGVFFPIKQGCQTFRMIV